MNFLLFAPEFVVLSTGFAVLGLDLVMNRGKSNYLPGVCVAGLVVSLLVTLLYLADWQRPKCLLIRIRESPFQWPILETDPCEHLLPWFYHRTIPEAFLDWRLLRVVMSDGWLAVAEMDKSESC